MSSNALITGADGKIRCWWCGNDPLYVKYHDEEWGKPVYDDVRLFEKICLEGFQSGLSWLTILRKRKNFRKAFSDFDFEVVAGFNQKKVEILLQNSEIIRHRGKIEATINNAKKAIDLVEEYGSLSDYFWRFKPESYTYTIPKHIGDIPQKTKESNMLAIDLKNRGWQFVGSVTCYAFMQSVGIVNDHIEGCYCRIKMH